MSEESITIQSVESVQIPEEINLEEYYSPIPMGQQVMKVLCRYIVCQLLYRLAMRLSVLQIQHN